MLPCSGDQHGAGCGASFAELLKRGPYAGAASSNLHAKDGVVVLRIDGRRFESDLVPVRIEFFRKQHGQRGIDTLAHFRVVHDHGDAIVGADAHEGIGHEDSC